MMAEEPPGQAPRLPTFYDLFILAEREQALKAILAEHTRRKDFSGLRASFVGEDEPS